MCGSCASWQAEEVKRPPLMPQVSETEIQIDPATPPPPPPPPPPLPGKVAIPAVFAPKPESPEKKANEAAAGAALNPGLPPVFAGAAPGQPLLSPREPGPALSPREDNPYRPVSPEPLQWMQPDAAPQRPAAPPMPAVVADSDDLDLDDALGSYPLSSPHTTPRKSPRSSPLWAKLDLSRLSPRFSPRAEPAALALALPAAAVPAAPPGAFAPQSPAGSRSISPAPPAARIPPTVAVRPSPPPPRGLGAASGERDRLGESSPRGGSPPQEENRYRSRSPRVKETSPWRVRDDPAVARVVESPLRRGTGSERSNIVESATPAQQQ